MRFYNQCIPVTKWWEKVALWFVKEHYMDDDTKDLKTRIYYKHLLGRMYITDIVHHVTIGEFVIASPPASEPELADT